MIRVLAFLLLSTGTAGADTLVAAHTIRAQTVLQPTDLARMADSVAGGVDDPTLLVGLEARVTLYAGRPVRLGDVGPPAIIDRNQIVTLIYANGGITIRTEGRALDRAGVGDRIRAMNLTSRSTITGRVTTDGRIRVEGESS